MQCNDPEKGYESDSGSCMYAKDSFVAHMWRKPDDPRTRAKYTLKAGQVTFCMRKMLIRWLLFLSWKLIESIIPGPYVASPMLTRYQNNEA